MPANLATPFYDPGRDITGFCTAAVIGKRFLKISGNRTSGPSPVSDAVDGGNIHVAHADAAGRIIGVAGYDAAINKLVLVRRGNSLVIPVLAAAPIAAFQEVEVGANGQAVPLAAGKAVGFAYSAAGAAEDAQICLY